MTVEAHAPEVIGVDTFAKEFSKCQINPYLQELTTKVKSCERVDTKNGDRYRVVLAETILFAEGGGQPSDHGKINDVSVLELTRASDGTVIHLLPQALEIGASVHVTLDWKRRYDHMQQHSAQHLISAIADDKFGLKTQSWSLGETKSSIDFEPALTPEKMRALEDAVNEQIRVGKPVRIHLLSPDSVPSTVRSRNLKATGAVRLVEISGVDTNTCCGTHVASLSDLHMVKFVSLERNGSRCFFIAGNRVSDNIDEWLNKDRELKKLLNCGEPEHVAFVDRLKKDATQALKIKKDLTTELAQAHAQLELLKVEPGKTPLVILHREESEQGSVYMSAAADAVIEKAPNAVVLITVGLYKNPPKKGQKPEDQERMFLLRGPEEYVKQVSEKLLTLLQGKGGGRKGISQGKAGSFANLEELWAHLRASLPTTTA
eukprot:TRINITY_DN1729_c0_g1::TRINITY_DN1729_c0_g1_i1::g.25162::m.25162 TRINITY_DN1729_c0_g1::TRINITY_DN1729_c0_g1_i1::g.25162  ORF type:complete len:449 (+),score=99.06,sp/Q6DEJ5/AASD1_DANRE/40.09/1e-83,tRNA-synt_2c/PF01411.14/1.2e-06,tRNA_SAD/PF07973.9/1.6e-05,PhaP_Bmeg/PF09602.5/0.61,PhaP_Bmeg/PF09602.5/1.7e+02,Peptidase_S49/PF01343.13/15,Peptidase_S49/PF01343.13/25 TRINITY_DN1729_c0_g1_i1:56-1348(+)